MFKVLQQQPAHNHRERLHRLSEKISEVRVYTEQEKSSRLRAIEQTLSFIEDNIFECQESFTKALKNLEDNIGVLQQDVDEDKREADTLISNDLQELLKFEQKLQDAYDGIVQRRREHESGIAHLLDEKTGFLSSEIENESTIRQDSVKQLTQIYQSDIKKLRNGLAQATADREAEDEKIDNYMQSNLGKMTDDVTDLQKYSENSEKTIFNAIKSSVVEIKTVLDNEKGKRENTHEHMIKLLEDSYRNFRSQEE